MTNEKTSKAFFGITDGIRGLIRLRRLKKRYHTISVWRRSVLPALVVLFVVRSSFVWTSKPGQRFIPPGLYEVIDVPDAFQMVVRSANRQEPVRIRILGVESIPNDVSLSSNGAIQFIRDACLNRQVRVHLGRRRLDNDQTLLAHIYLDDNLLSAELIRRGLARKSVSPSDSSRITKILRDAEEASERSSS